MKHITDVVDLFGSKWMIESNRRHYKRKPLSERSLLIGEISDKTRYSVGRVCERTTGLKAEDLYYLLSFMKDSVSTGRKSSYRHAFNSALFVPKK